MKSELFPAERRLKIFLKLILIVSLLTVFFHIFPRFTPAFLLNPATNSYALISNNSFIQEVLVIFLLALAIGDVRRFSPLIRLFKWLLLIALVLTAIHWIRGDNQPTGTTYLTRLITYAIVLATLWILFRAAGKARYNLKYLSIQQFQTLEALAEVCLAGDSFTEKLKISPVEVAHNVDQYLISFKAKSKWVMKLVLTGIEVYPLLSLH
ncbi:MAG: hypothetical protein ACR2KZ_05655, partial [Segetibacter sp.]